MFDATHSNFLPITWERAEGHHVWDDKGRKYIDFTSAIFVTNCGHGLVAKAIRKQSEDLIHCYTYDTKIKREFLASLENFLPTFCEKVYLACSGSEVTSWALKLMRNYKKRNLIVHFEGAFHGKTGQAGELSDEELKLPFPEINTFYRDIEVLEKYKDQIAGLMFETYQGWSAKFMNIDYIQKVVGWAKENDIPVCFDEIQAGFYRTGKKFGYEHYQIEPDLICLGKALGGGMPLSALTGRAKYFMYSDMSSTHTGHPLCCAAGKAALEYYETLSYDFVIKCRSFERWLESMAKQSAFKDHVQGVNVKGMLGAIIFKNKEFADMVCINCAKRGLLVVNTGKNSVKLGPPLTISEQEINEAINNILDDSIEEAINA